MDLENKLRFDFGELVDEQPPYSDIANVDWDDMKRVLQDREFTRQVDFSVVDFVSDFEEFPKLENDYGDDAYFTSLSATAHGAADNILPFLWSFHDTNSFARAVEEYSGMPMALVSNDDTNQPRATDRQPPTVYDDFGYGSLGTKSVAQGLDRLDAIYERDAASLLRNPYVSMYVFAFAKELAMSMPLEFDGKSLEKPKF
ncbi:hypothetical protein C8A03DRAFT_39167 [Achaetomium macrosporum]|uniref:Uncharacterized protein n=1 Tax=Achaetomium macrosporum TaxID=79813 RepID=A0AAN7H6F1_9PEZI|nr:hypothetical protein C8A03DRAFT_39167 [Achaetomium macrosporum]